ncbi:hypothetical protein WMY93_000357 [Mugilogobius chulae]|uniref:B30.2/SPRY domain-containing protein n=1 Tax=Mugilogobius chulae TaxID=88201 RepID=A0AAW0QE19_9GOBI
MTTGSTLLRLASLLSPSFRTLRIQPPSLAAEQLASDSPQEVVIVRGEVGDEAAEGDLNRGAERGTVLPSCVQRRGKHDELCFTDGSTISKKMERSEPAPAGSGCRLKAGSESNQGCVWSKAGSGPSGVSLKDWDMSSEVGQSRSSPQLRLSSAPYGPGAESLRSDNSKEFFVEFKDSHQSISIGREPQMELDFIFQHLEKDVLTFVKEQLQRLHRLLASDYPECSESEEEEQSSREVLNITLDFLRRMDQEQLAQRLQNRTKVGCSDKLKSDLQQRFSRVFEGVAKAGDSAPLNQIYTELYITEGGASEVNQEHEVRLMESRRAAAPEKTITCEDMFKARPHSPEPIRAVLTKGVPAWGKTVLTQKFSLDWAEGRANQELQLLFPFTFRELNVLRDTQFSLVELLHHFFSPSKALWQLPTAPVIQKLLEQTEEPELPRTLTQMYVHFLVVQAKVQNIKYQQGSGADLHWTPETRNMVLSLGKLAFEQLQKGNLIFYESDLSEWWAGRCSGLSVLRSVHTGLTESNGHLDLFLRFLLGLSLPTNQKLLQGLLSQTRSNQTDQETVKYIKEKLNEKDLSAERSLNLLHCLNELNDNSLGERDTRGTEGRRLSFKDISPGDWSAVCFLLLSSDSDLQEFDLRKYQASETALLGLLPVVKASTKALLSLCGLSPHCCGPLASVLSSSSLTHLDLSHNDLQDSGVELLCDWLKSAPCRLETLRLSGCLVSQRGGTALASALSSAHSHLTELDLSYNHPGPSAELLTALRDDPHCPLDSLRLDPAGEQWMVPGLRKYACEFSLDPNTAHRKLLLSEDNRTAVCVKEKQQYPDDEDRFTYYIQVLSSTGLSGCCYWEVDWSEQGGVSIAVSYRGIRRRGEGWRSGFGYNDQSWILRICDGEYFVWHNNKHTQVSTSPHSDKESSGEVSSGRVGVFLDSAAGLLSFYHVCSAGELSTSTPSPPPSPSLCLSGFDWEMWVTL